MSRKARIQDKTAWAVPKIHVLTGGGYGPYKVNDAEPISSSSSSSSSSGNSSSASNSSSKNDIALVWLCHSGSSGDDDDADDDDDHHHHHQNDKLSYLMKLAEDALLTQNLPKKKCECGKNDLADSSRSQEEELIKENKQQSIMVIDIKDMFEDEASYRSLLQKELEETSEVTKMFGKKLIRLFQRLMFHNVVLATHGRLCPFVVKLAKALTNTTNKPDMLSDVWLLCPTNISSKFINMNLVVSCNGTEDTATPPTGAKSIIACKLHCVVVVVDNTSTSTSNNNNQIQNRSRRLDDILKHHFQHVGIQEIRLNSKKDDKVKKNWFSIVLRGGQHFGQDDPVSTSTTVVTTTTTTTTEDFDRCDCEDDEGEEDYDDSTPSSSGQKLFVTRIKVEMNRFTKQYERLCEDGTYWSEVMTMNESSTTTTAAATTTVDESSSNGSNTIPDHLVDWDMCEKHVGALLLRGNRCILVRSLSNQWKGIWIPSVVPSPDEDKTSAAIRAVVQHCDVDEDEVRPLKHVMPVAVYAPNGRPIMVEMYALYATQPPPDYHDDTRRRRRPLADVEDPHSLYDWYKFENASSRVDVATRRGIQCMVFNLMQASSVGLIPNKYGGIFGQECFKNKKRNQMILDESLQLGSAQHDGDGDDDGLGRQQTSDAVLFTSLRKAKEILEATTNERPNNTEANREGKLQVVLLSGFLGSGKTTLMSHILANYEGLKVAILVNDMGDINIDAALIKSGVSVRQRQEHMVELSNGCICCTLREDLLTEVANIASDRSFDYLLIESSGISEPMPVVETFTFEDDSTGLCLGDVAEIDTLVTVVDGSRFMMELESLQTLMSRNWHDDPDDSRTISHLLCDQVECANVIVLNKCDLMSRSDKVTVKSLIHEMNPTARIVESEFSRVPLENVLGTKLFSMTDAEQHEGWLQEARIGEHTPETEEYGIGSFTYRAHRPFVPHKLQELLQVLLDREESPFDQCDVLRAKGFVWLASCPQLQGDFSLAGNQITLAPGEPWWAEIDKSDWPEGLDDGIAPVWKEPHGDRRQEIVIIGRSLDEAKINGALDKCLVTKKSMKKGQEVWDRLVEKHGDPFEFDVVAAEMAMEDGDDEEADEHNTVETHDDHVHDHPKSKYMTHQKKQRVA